MPVASLFTGHSILDKVSESISPLTAYQRKLEQAWCDDPTQRQALQQLDALFWQLTHQHNEQADRQPANSHAIRGVYLWGDVGRGKTVLMDLFYDCLPEHDKIRLHFHRFMARIHQDLKQYAGQRSPLEHIAKALANEAKIICFDEFFVSDIADAMILSGLFEALFTRGVVLVATSNIPIERLYENGLARHRFMPCIDLLLAHCHSIHLAGLIDHRLQHLTTADGDAETGLRSDGSASNLMLSNLSLTKDGDLSSLFNRLTQQTWTPLHQGTLHVCNRNIPVKAVYEEVVWFDFQDLCAGPRSQLDYIELASQFRTLLLSNVPMLGGDIKTWIRARGTEDGVGENQAASTGERQLAYAANDDPARRFISLVDELYDQGVMLYLSCDVSLNELYQGGALSFEFKRTFSRLIEMGRS